ncbi:MAG: protein-tyrosine kinase [Lachnospiraceae bacterium]|nr:protein-tyrosine kinase [Lachnospiraceae bacterium]
MDTQYNASASDEIEIDLREIFAVLLHYAWAIILSAVIVGVAAFAVSKFVITPTYESTTRIVILAKDSGESNITYSDMQLGTQLTKDYAELITSRYVVEQVIENFQLDATYSAFVEKINVSTPSDTRIIDITMTDEDPMLAKQMVDELRSIAAKRIEEVMDVDAVNLVDEGYVATEPSDPSVLKWTAIGILLGGFMAAAVVLIRFLLDDTIKSSEDIERYLKLSTLALIPIAVEEEEKSGRKHRSSQKKSDSEAHKAAIEAVLAENEDEEENEEA